jgi:hypothetical protein
MNMSCSSMPSRAVYVAMPRDEDKDGLTRAALEVVFPQAESSMSESLYGDNKAGPGEVGDETVTHCRLA